MLLTYGKIKTINQEHPILNPSLDMDMNFYNGHYFIPDGLKLKGDESDIIIDSGFLEVYTNQSDNYDGINGKAFYINYKLTTKKGLIYTWRYYVNKVEDVVAILDKSDQPTLLLTTKSLNKLSYTRREMEERFFLRRDSHFDEPNYFIGLPILELKAVNDVPPALNFENMTTFYKNEPKKRLTLMKDLPLEHYYRVEFDISLYIDGAIHKTESSEQWNDVFQAKPNWDKEYRENKQVSESNGLILPSQRKTFGTWSMMSYLHMKLGDYYFDIPRFEGESITTNVHVSRIINNTYLPYYKMEGDRQYNDAFLNHMKNAYMHTTSPLFMSRIFVTPDEGLKTYPVVHYAKSYYLNKAAKNDSGIHLSLNRWLDYYDTRHQVIGNTNMTVMYGTGILTSTATKKKDPQLLFDDLKNKVKNTALYYDGPFGEFFGNMRDKWHKHIFSNMSTDIDTVDREEYEIYFQLFDLDPIRPLYRSFSDNILELNHYNDFINTVRNDSMITEDIRLGPEVRIVLDKSNTDLIAYNDRLMEANIKSNKPNWVLTYFKPEIVKSSPRYKTNPDLAYDPAYTEQVDFFNRITQRNNLTPNEKLAIDKLTLGFRPIQVKERGVWKDITEIIR